MTRRRAIIVIIALCLCLILLFSSIRFFVPRRGRLKQIEEFTDYISEVAELIIPRTESPGANDAGVPQYIIKTLKNCYSPKDQTTVITGLEKMEAYCLNLYGISFLKCTIDQRTETLKHFMAKRSFSNEFLNKIRRKLTGPTYFEIIRELTVSGYCTSEMGATRGLAYDEIPGNYSACKELQTNQKSWALK